MRLVTIFLVLTLIAGSPGFAKDKRRHKKAPSHEIACTVLGCVPVPRGCRQVPGVGWDGTPTGFDIIVCPPGVAPF
jgi:hypothetical protein